MPIVLIPQKKIGTILTFDTCHIRELSCIYMQGKIILLDLSNMYFYDIDSFFFSFLFNIIKDIDVQRCVLANVSNSLSMTKQNGK